MEMEDIFYMKKVLALAKKGWGRVSPNPMVGALLVKNGKIIGTGYHKGPGKPHAEREAIKNARESVKGATLYVNLEPCCHYGRTPPCTEIIIKSGIKRVVASIKDPNPLVNGRGFEILESHGIEVVKGVLEEEAGYLNEIYLKYIQTRRPFVILKAALTLDGRLGNPELGIKKITGEKSLKWVHYLRKGVDGILVGKGTVLSDDPSLTTRLVKGKNPVRFVLDTHLSIPRSKRIFKEPGKTIVVSTEEGEGVWKVGRDKKGRVNLHEFLELAGKNGITSLLVEGGSEVFTSFLEENLVDKLYLFYAPFTSGGVPFLREGVLRHFRIRKIRKMGEDIMLEAYPCSRE